MEITEEALKSSLNELQDLEKSQNDAGIGEPLKKSAEIPAAADVENSGGEEDLNKAGGEHTSEQGHGDMYKMQGHDEPEEAYHERMKKMGDHGDMAKMHGGASTGYHGEPTKMEGESDHSYEIRKKNMAVPSGDMHKMAYSQAGEENDLLKAFQEDGQLKKAIDVSDFLKSLVERTTLHLSAVDERLEKSFSILLETIDAQNEVIAKQTTQLEGLQKSFENVLSQPVGGPRSLGHGIQPIGRGPGDLNKGQNNQNPMALKKSILNNMMLACEKGEIRDTDLIKFESTGEISNENLSRFGSQG